MPVEVDNLNDRLSILKEIESAHQRIEAIEQSTGRLTKIRKSHIEEERRLIDDLAKKLKEVNQERLSEVANMEKSIGSMSSMYSSLTKLEKQQLTMMAQNNNLSSIQVAGLSKIYEINQSIASLSREDTLQRIALTGEYDNQLKSLQDAGSISSDIIDNLKSQNVLANNYANLTEGQKSRLEGQLEVYDKIKKSIGGVLDTAALMTKGWKGAIGMMMVGSGLLINKLGAVRKEMGGMADAGTTALSFIDSDAVANSKELAAHMGGINNVSDKLKLSTSLISANMGITGTEAAGLIGTFTRLSGGSAETALNLMKSSQEFARQNGIIPSELMKDMASSTEEIALFGKQGGKNMLQAATAAAKMGVSLKTLTGLSENLLNFESSITTEMELGALLGRNLNLDKARALAYQGDIAGATAETLKALGGIDAFSKMDYFTKKKTSELLGISVEELQNMVALQKNADTITGKMNAKLSVWSEGWNAFVNTGLGKAVTGLGGMLVMVGQMGYGLKTIVGPLKAAWDGIGALIKKMFAAKAVSESLSQAPAMSGRILSPKQIAAGFGGKKAKDALLNPASIGSAEKGVGSVSKFNVGSMVKGAAALLILAGALWVSAKAFQQFATVDWKSVGMGALALVVFTAAMFGLGALIAGPGAIIFGAGVIGLLALGAALLVFGSGLAMVGVGMSTLAGVADTISALSQVNFMSIFGLAGALGTLAIALGAVSAAGVLALPILAGVGTFATVVGGTAGSDKELVDEIKGLRADLNAGKIAVYLDGKKLTAAVASQAGKVTSNSYSNR